MRRPVGLSLARGLARLLALGAGHAHIVRLVVGEGRPWTPSSRSGWTSRPW